MEVEFDCDGGGAAKLVHDLPSTIERAYDAYADYAWAEDDAMRTRLIIAHGGLLAQDRWMREKGLWTADRYRAARSSARHDFALVDELRADPGVVTQTRAPSRALLNRLWKGVLAAAERLNEAG